MGTASIRSRVIISIIAVLLTTIAGIIIWALINNTPGYGFHSAEKIDPFSTYSHDPNFSKYDQFLFGTEKSEAFNNSAYSISTGISHK